MARDLTDPHAAKLIYDEVKAAGIQIDYLINNAGFGGHGKFHERPWETGLKYDQSEHYGLNGIDPVLFAGHGQKK